MHEMLSRAITRTSAVVREVRDDQLGLPTPCADYDVRALLGHMSRAAATFDALARKEEAPAKDSDHTAFESRAAGMLAAWSNPEAFEGSSPDMGLPMTVVFHMGLSDVVIHGWDLARSIGQDYEVDAETAETMAAFADRMAPQGRQMGIFGEEVAVSDDASAFERALALSGRDPAWKP
ncbi:TIGR03086 family metal-binding protein [Rhizohabitans arisaemae]|uniref:TIGR03086 family metal-binding protein n=1 Tax=Rhizohabitans arisaemae TaxID=2720610 RepID=UPI0024B044DE|nr:TIGR03086 family metal-binding protein [Rhizohabitans arisaemae]